MGGGSEFGRWWRPEQGNLHRRAFNSISRESEPKHCGQRQPNCSSCLLCSIEQNVSHWIECRCFNEQKFDFSDILCNELLEAVTTDQHNLDWYYSLLTDHICGGSLKELSPSVSQMLVAHLEHRDPQLLESILLSLEIGKSSPKFALFQLLLVKTK